MEPSKLIQLLRCVGSKMNHARFFIDMACSIGVRLLICQPSLDLHGFTMEVIIEGVEMIGGQLLMI